jgi:GH24 family phage-related lysozyme (muramidase)
MQISSEGLKLIQSAENFSAVPYLDTANIWTIGWGHALTTPTGQVIDCDVFGRAKAGQLAAESMTRLFGRQTCTREEADALLTKDLATYVAAVNKIADATTYQCEFDAMVSFCFNSGVANFNSSAICRLHRANQRKIGDISLSGLAQQSKAHADPSTMGLAFARWSNSNGNWTLGLFRRRMAELLVYSGRPAAESLQTAWAFKG